MQKITLKSIKTYAFHGCMKEERIIGSDYLVDITLEADLSLACKSDDLKDTIDYGAICGVALEEMAVPSNLLEHVAQRILDRLLTFPNVNLATVSVTKINPPIDNADIQQVSVSITKTSKSQ